MRRLVLAFTVVASLLATGLSSPASATYVGRDGKLAFVRGNDVFSIAAAGGGAARRLTDTGKNLLPKWSPDGRQIAYIHQKPSGARDVWVMLASGLNKTRVTFLSNVTTAPAWSPDGKLLAFGAGASDGLAVLYEISGRAPYGSPTVVQGYHTGCTGCVPDPTDLHPVSVDRYLAWSPDGTTIAIFNHDDVRFDDAIYMYNVGTREARQYDRSGADCCGYIDWSDLAWGPGGAFGFTAGDTGELDGVPPYLHIEFPGFISAEGDRYPAPSPAGTRMAFSSPVTGRSTIYIASVTGAGRRAVTNGEQPDWQPLP
jgi:Tol biopolymer transport system component